MKVFLAASLLLAATAPALAAEPPAPESTAKPDGDADKIICRRQVVVGSRLPGPRQCKTKAQWNSNDRDSQDAARKAQDNRRAILP